MEKSDRTAGKCHASNRLDSTNRVQANVTGEVNALLSVLRELVIAAGHRPAGAMLQAAVSTTETTVHQALRESLPRKPPAAQDLEEAQRLGELNKSTLDVSEDMVSGERVITLKFAVVR